MAANIKKYYDYNMPRGEFIRGEAYWDNGAAPSLTVTPETDYATFVTKVKFIVSNDFAMSAADTITITLNAYDRLIPQVFTVTATATVATDLAAIFSLCSGKDAASYTLGAADYHSCALEFKSPVYLRSSPTVADTVVIEYTNVGGGITAGEMFVSYEGYTILEADSEL